MHVHRVARLAGLLAVIASLLPATAASAAEFEVLVEDFEFVPADLTVNAGDTVTWSWTGQQQHDVTPVEAEAFEASPLQREGQHQVTFEAEGFVPYYCSIHGSADGSSGMVGSVSVLPEGEPLPTPGPEPRPEPEPGRLPAAEDNVGTALAWSALFEDGSAPFALLGRDDVFADSLTSGAAQGLTDGPLLLTPTDTLDQRVIDELVRLGTTNVEIFGGESAISAEVEAQLVELGYVIERIEGPTRIETATAAAQAFFPQATTAFLVRSEGTPGGDPSQGFADSLAVGGAAASAELPILLSQTAGLSASTSEYLTAHPEITLVYVVGGEAALSAQVVDDLMALGIDVVRLEGPTRFETAYAVTDTFYDFGGTSILVDGQGPDAWVSGFAAASAAESAPIVLANGDDLTPRTVTDASFGQRFLCGPGVSAVACDRVEIAATSVQFGEDGTKVAALDGASEVPGPGQDLATADFTLKPTSAPDAFCYEASTYGIGEAVTGAHIHDGAAGEAGDVVVPLTPLGDDTFLASCAFDVDPVLLADILANPSAYYANFHTETFPAGAVRGQLFTADVIGLAFLDGASEVPPVEVAGGGVAVLIADADDPTRLAYFLGYGFADGTQGVAGHIHEAPEGENGDVVQALTLPETGNEEGAFEGSFLLEGVDPALVEDLLADPSAYYVNVHTAEFPGGALRGQVTDIFGAEDGDPPAEGTAAFAAHRG